MRFNGGDERVGLGVSELGWGCGGWMGDLRRGIGESRHTFLIPEEAVESIMLFK